MSDGTAIEWTDATWSPVTGCTKVSPGCANCYIERQTPFRIAGRKFVKGEIPLVFHEDRLDQPLHWRRPRMVFVCSMSDLFHEQVPDEYIWRIWLTMAQAEQHTFQVLTKRPERARDLLREWNLMCWALPNVWVGTTIENARHTYRADVLREIPAAVRFISAEPLLGSLFVPADDTRRPPSKLAAGRSRLGEPDRGASAPQGRAPLDLTEIDWVICGGESGGRHVRPMDPEWARELRDRILGMGEPEPGFFDYGGPAPGTAGGWVPSREGRPAFFFKQHGSYRYGEYAGASSKAGGKDLDGMQWCEMPRVR